jgi:cell division protein ZapE
MVDVHNRLHKKKNESSVIPNIVKNLKAEYDIIFLDEFQVTNIADAMILGKLLEQFYSKNIFIVTTSNVRPDNLYLGGLQRGQFLPYIEMIKQNSVIYSLDTGADYRQLFLNKKNKFFPLTNLQAKKMFNDVLLGTLNGKKFSTTTLTVKGRKVVIKNFVSNIAKFDFKDLFFENYSAEDYIEMSKIIKIFFIENIPNFNEDLINEQYRFVNFIDVIYDNKLKLVATAATEINNLTSSSKVQKVFSRTLSRLKELTAVR